MSTWWRCASRRCGALPWAPWVLVTSQAGKKKRCTQTFRTLKEGSGIRYQIYIYIRVFFQFYYFLHLYTFINTDYPCAFTRGHVFTKSAGLNLAKFYNCSHLPASVECCSLAVYTTLPTWKRNDSRCERVEHVLIRSPADWMSPLWKSALEWGLHINTVCDINIT